MASVLEYVEELLVDVGPRPAGSEKEFQASEIIANRFEEFGLGTQVEEFDCYPFAPWMPLIGYALVVFGVLFSFFIPGAGIAGLIMVTLGLLIVLLEMFNLNPIHKIIPTKLSQNVIARYVPTGSINNDRPRKVVILAHYDSGRGMIEAIPSIGKQIKLLRMALRIALVAAFVTAILVLIPVLPELAMTIARYIMLVSAIIVAIALVVGLVNQFQPVQNAANCNASGVAVLYNLAEKLATQGSMSSAAVPGTASRRRRRRSGAGDNEPGLALQQAAGEPSAYQQTGQPPFTETTEGPAAGFDTRQDSGELIPDRIGSGEVSITFNPEDTLSAMPSASQSVAGNLVQVGTERRSPFVFDRAPATQLGSLEDAELGEGGQPVDSDAELQQSAELA
ncbi:MAG: hypothetical protein LBG68_02900, partial [Coriobacteriales bacterium]|nr:hypothetical protein [Coriobacteriales bacterium]